MPKPNAEDWYVPNRPNHPDAAVLMDLCLQADAASSEGHGDAYIDRWLSGTATTVAREAQQEIARLTADYGHLPMEKLGTVAWMIGFGAGVRASRGQTLSEADSNMTPQEAQDAAFGGADEASVRYVADQRAWRALSPNSPLSIPSHVTADMRLGGLWFEAVIVGTRYDASRAERLRSKF